MDDKADVRAAVQMAVINICEVNNETMLTPRATATVAELTLQFVRCSLVPNLDAFAKHASRRRITEQDVLLTLRNHREYHQKVQEKLEHFKRTNDVLAAPDHSSKRREVRLEKRADPSSDSSGSSDESTAPAVVASRKKTPQQQRTKFDDTFSSSDDGLNAIRSKLSRKKPPGAMAMKQPVSKRRPSFKFSTSPESSAELPSAEQPIPAIMQTQSKRVQEIILENQDDESMPSDCE